MHSRANEIRQAIAAAAPLLVARLLEAAQAGDIQAATALLDRVAPRLRTSAAPIVCDTTGSTTELAQRLLLAVGRGEIAAPEAVEVLDLAARAQPPGSDEPPPIDHEKLDAIYRDALKRAEEQRLAFRHRSDPDYLAQFDGEQHE